MEDIITTSSADQTVILSKDDFLVFKKYCNYYINYFGLKNFWFQIVFDDRGLLGDSLSQIRYNFGQQKIEILLNKFTIKHRVSTTINSLMKEIALHEILHAYIDSSLYPFKEIIDGEQYIKIKCDFNNESETLSLNHLSHNIINFIINLLFINNPDKNLTIKE